MDIEFYRNFLTIVNAGSISAAAKRLAIAQPALSNQLKILNKHIGAPLLNVKRGGHFLELTEEGKIFYNKAQYICGMEDAALKEIKDVQNGSGGTLRISLSPSMSISVIKTYLTGFTKLNPKINFELFEASPDEQLKQLLSSETEIGVTNGPLKQPFLFETINQKRENLVALFHKKSPYISSKSVLLLEDLEKMPLCLSRGCAELFNTICQEQHISTHILSITTTKLSAIAWAEQNIGIAIVPTFKGEIFPKNLIMKTIKHPRLYLTTTISFVKDRPLSAVAKLFLDYLNNK
ncbi:MAG: LysR family transcriptional regulator [Acidaminococcaceae bacterium]|nr:LysR family transcriptional regulator [Acidaminococcaceae bacterium]